jgi:hypothetical protein
VFLNQVKMRVNCMTMDQRRNDYLREAQHRVEMLAIIEFDSPFPRFDTLPREGVIILCLQGFGV